MKKETILESLMEVRGDEKPLIESIEEERCEPSDLPKLVHESRLAKSSVIVELSKRLMYYEAKASALEAFFAPYLEAYEAERNFLLSRAERARLGVASLLPAGEEFVDDSISISWRKTFKGEIVDRAAIPLEYCKIKDPEPSLEMLKAAAQKGEKVPGYEVRTNFHMKIGPGGAKAKSNARARERKRLEGKTEEE